MMNAYFRSRDGVVDGPFFEGQLLSMWEAGQLVATDLLCLQGDEEWHAVDTVMGWLVEARDEAQVVAKAAVPVVAEKKVKRKTAKRKRKTSGRLGAIIFLIMGLGMLAFFWPVGVVMILAALISDKAFWICSGCGNKIEKTSKVCPVCKSVLTR